MEKTAKTPAIISKSKNFGLSIARGDNTSPLKTLFGISENRKESLEEVVNCEKNVMGSPNVGIVKAIIEECKNANELAYSFYFWGILSHPTEVNVDSDN